MQQRTLFDTPTPTLPPANFTDTSRAAARAIAPATETQRAAVLDFLTRRGAQGATDLEMQAGLAMPGDTQRPRRWELQRAGLIRDSGERRRTPTGRQAIVWVVN